MRGMDSGRALCQSPLATVTGNAQGARHRTMSTYSADDPATDRASATRANRRADFRAPLEQALVRALDELSDGVVVFSGDRILAVSDAFCRIVDRDRGDLLDLASIFELVAEPVRGELRDQLRRYLAGEDVADHFDTVVVSRSRGPRDVEASVKTVDAAGPDTIFTVVARDVTDLRRDAAFARMLSAASDLVASARSEDEAIRGITRLVVPVLADWCAFDIEIGPGALRRTAVAHVHPAGEELLWELDRQFPIRRYEGNLRARVLRSGEPLVINAPTESSLRAAARNRDHAEMLQKLGIGAGMWIPVTSFGRTHGVMSLGLSASGRGFGEAELAVAEKLGHRAAQAIGRSRAEQTLRVRERQQAAVAELGRLALAGLELAALNQQAVELVAATIDVEYSAVLEVDARGERLRLVAGVGWHPGVLGLATVGADRESQAGYTLLSGGPVIVEDLRTESRFNGPALLHDHGVVSGMSVVIASSSMRPYGVLGTHSTTRRDFTHDDVNFLQSMANVLAAAIDRQGAELALRESDERLHIALAASRTGTWEWDLGRGGLSWSAEIGILHGIPPEDFPTSFEEYLLLVHPEDRALLQAEIERAFREGMYDFDFRILWHDGTVRWTNGQAKVFYDSSGAPVRMVGTGRDVTDRKTAELERDRLLGVERQATAVREAFIGVLSHELRTPITTILGGARLLADRRDTLPAESVTELFRDIGQEADRLNRLVEDLLVLTRSERGEVDQRDEPILPSQLVARLAPQLLERAGSLELAVDVPPSLPMVAGDETYLEQVLRNLVGNALKFSPADGTVDIAAEVTPTEVILRVLDRGPGIADDEAERLFELFYRSPRTRAKTVGSGIGLFVARRLIDAMDGRIWARPRDGGGAEFGFALRRYAMPEEPPVE